MRYLSVAALFLFCIATIGCGGSSIDSALAKLSKENVQKTCAMYSIYAVLHDYKGPSNREEFIEFMKTDEQAKIRMDRLKIDPDRVEEYLIGRDGEPFEFRWSVESNPMSGGYPICWEQVGVDGQIQVGISGGKIVETSDEDELEELKKGIYDAGGSYNESQAERSEQ